MYVYGQAEVRSCGFQYGSDKRLRLPSFHIQLRSKQGGLQQVASHQKNHHSPLNLEGGRRWGLQPYRVAFKNLQKKSANNVKRTGWRVGPCSSGGYLNIKCTTVHVRHSAVYWTRLCLIFAAMIHCCKAARTALRSVRGGPLVVASPAPASYLTSKRGRPMVPYTPPNTCPCY